MREHCSVVFLLSMASSTSARVCSGMAGREEKTSTMAGKCTSMRWSNSTQLDRKRPTNSSKECALRVDSKLRLAMPEFQSHPCRCLLVGVCTTAPVENWIFTSIRSRIIPRKSPVVTNSWYTQKKAYRSCGTLASSENTSNSDTVSCAKRVHDVSAHVSGSLVSVIDSDLFFRRDSGATGALSLPRIFFLLFLMMVASAPLDPSNLGGESNLRRAALSRLEEPSRFSCDALLFRNHTFLFSSVDSTPPSGARAATDDAQLRGLRLFMLLLLLLLLVVVVKLWPRGLDAGDLNLLDLEGCSGLVGASADGRDRKPTGPP